MDINSLKEKLTLSAINFFENEPMCKHTTFNIGGPADLFIETDSEETVKKIVDLCNEFSVPITVIGKGSNLLVSDKGIEGLVLACSASGDSISLSDGDRITAKAGVALISVCKFALEHSLCGLEFAYGIPASVGGALFMNAGAYDGSISDVVESAVCITDDGKLLNIKNADMEFGYRESVFKRKCFVVLSATFKLKKGDSCSIKSRMDELMNRRRDKQPLEFPSAGSVFKRPKGHFAGALIEECGLKGCRIGGAEVSLKHGGFIINRGNATCDDVLALVDKIQKTVYEKTGVMLEPEIRMIGKR